MSQFRHRRKGPNRRPTWESLQRNGLLPQRHALMAEEMGFDPKSLLDEYGRHGGKTGRLLLIEWVEDRFFERFGRYVPVDESATPGQQAEHQAENPLLPDPNRIIADYIRASGMDEDSDDWIEGAMAAIRQSEHDTPVSYGELHEEDEAMLQRQENFRKAARLLAAKLAGLSGVEKVVLFGSVALPLWKEVPRFSRLRRKQKKIYHECNDINLAVWTSAPARAGDLRKAFSQLVNELVAQDIHLGIASHHFSVHLVDAATVRYLGMVCHFARCPADKPVCLVEGCGAVTHVRILPWFRLKPERLNEHNSLVLFQRGG